MKRWQSAILLTGAGVILAACQATGIQPDKNQTGNSQIPDAVSSASTVYYEQSSLSQEQILEAIKNSQGSCTIATVNADGTPHLSVATPGVADENHIMFGLAPGVTKSNIDRTGKAVICYYLLDTDKTDKFERNRGARLVLEVEKEEAALKAMNATEIPTYLKIIEVLPIG